MFLFTSFGNSNLVVTKDGKWWDVSAVGGQVYSQFENSAAGKLPVKWNRNFSHENQHGNYTPMVLPVSLAVWH